MSTLILALLCFLVLHSANSCSTYLSCYHTLSHSAMCFNRAKRKAMNKATNFATSMPVHQREERDGALRKQRTHLKRLSSTSGPWFLMRVWAPSLPLPTRILTNLKVGAWKRPCFMGGSDALVLAMRNYCSRRLEEAYLETHTISLVNRKKQPDCSCDVPGQNSR